MGSYSHLLGLLASTHSRPYRHGFLLMDNPSTPSIPLSRIEQLLRLDLSSYSKTIYNIASLLVIFSLLAAGFLLKPEELFTAESGVGYWLGIIGGVLMLLLIIYPIRKHMKSARLLGSVRFWFKTHMFFGVAGPLAILYHSNFSTGSLNSTIALLCMLIVASSGFIGRYFYSKIHYGLYGQKASLTELLQSIEDEKGKLQYIYSITPELKQQLAALQINHDQHLSLAQSIQRFFILGTKIRINSVLIPQRLKKTVLAHAQQHQWKPQHTQRYLKLLNRYIRHYLNTSLKVCEFSIYERLFALWHTLHLPLFIMMLITGVIHVVAVHMY